MSGLTREYERRYRTVLEPLAGQLEQFVKHHLGSLPRIDRITARAKSVDRFIQKSQKLEGGKPKYSDPLNQIQDQIGARVVTFYKQDVETVSAGVPHFFTAVEQKTVVPDSPHQFGYQGHHFILFVPEDILDESSHDDGAPLFFELQVKTLFQHAWSEAEHDLGYKPTKPLTHDQQRRVAFTSAQSWGADQIFQELFDELAE
jgi:ppGpp synthetase/RelA/SpoT-type nucleotidyltranferase